MTTLNKFGDAQRRVILKNVWETIVLMHKFCIYKNSHKEEFQNTTVENFNIEAQKTATGITATVYGVSEEQFDTILRMFLSASYRKTTYTVLKEIVKFN